MTNSVYAFHPSGYDFTKKLKNTNLARESKKRHIFLYCEKIAALLFAPK